MDNHREPARPNVFEEGNGFSRLRCWGLSDLERYWLLVGKKQRVSLRLSNKLSWYLFVSVEVWRVQKTQLLCKPVGQPKNFVKNAKKGEKHFQ